MTIEYDEKGKIFTEIISKIPVQATIQTTTHLMRGRLHVRRDQRIKDELDVDENFIALTDVSVLGPDGQTLFQAPFMAVRRSHIVWVIPEQDKSEEKSSYWLHRLHRTLRGLLLQIYSNSSVISLRTSSAPWKGRNYSWAIARKL